MATPESLGEGSEDFVFEASEAHGLPSARGTQTVRRRADGLFDVTVTVSWRPSRGGRRQVVLQSVLEGAER